MRKKRFLYEATINRRVKDKSYDTRKIFFYQATVNSSHMMSEL